MAGNSVICKEKIAGFLFPTGILRPPNRGEVYPEYN
jgi:hypothetical protein